MTKKIANSPYVSGFALDTANGKVYFTDRYATSLAISSTSSVGEGNPAGITSEASAEYINP
jgi:hypothetical protein